MKWFLLFVTLVAVASAIEPLTADECPSVMSIIRASCGSVLGSKISECIKDLCSHFSSDTVCDKLQSLDGSIILNCLNSFSDETMCELLTNDPFLIKTQSDLDTFVSAMLYGFTLNVTLNIDIDASGISSPIGMRSTDCVPYSGTFDGNNHSITNIHMEGSKTGFFCGMKNAVVKDLIISSSCTFSGEQVGGLVAEIGPDTGDIIIKNVVNRATIEGTCSASGFIGSIANVSNKPSLKFEDCVYDGPISIIGTGCTQVSVGTFLASLTNSELILTLERCINYQSVALSVPADLESIAYGMVGYFYSNKYTTATARNCMNNGNVSVSSGRTNSALSGIFGRIVGSSINIVMEGNVNNGNIEFTSSDNDVVSCGGMIGEVSGGNYYSIKLNGNINNGNSKLTHLGVSMVGGILGYVESSSSTTSSISMNYNSNNGIITSNASSSFLGGLIGFSQSLDISVVNCENKEMISAIHASAICGLVCSNRPIVVKNSINKGHLKGSTVYGIASSIDVAYNVVSFGTLTGSSSAYSLSDVLKDTKNSCYYILEDNCNVCNNTEDPRIVFHKSGECYYFNDFF